MSGRFKFSKGDIFPILKVFGWTMASAVVALLISLMGVLEFPVEYALVVSGINVILYALQTFIKDNS